MSGDRFFDALLSETSAGRLAARERTFAKGEVVYREDDLGDTLHLVTRGMFAARAAMPTGANLILDVLEPGQVFGEFAVFTPAGRRSVGITALCAGETMEIRRGELAPLLRNRADIGEDLIALIVEKAHRTEHRLVDLLHVPAHLRVLRALLELTGGEGGTVSLTQLDLASFAATTRTTANRVLREEASRGTVTVARGRVTVIDPEGLTRRAKLGFDLPRPA